MTEPFDPAGGTAPQTMHVQYAGFWIRLLASILDTILSSMVIIPILLMFYDIGDFLVPANLGTTYYVISYGFPFLAFVLFWKYRAATPGKIWMDIYIVDADTLGRPSTARLVLRYLGYYVSLLPFGLGFLWVVFDPRKQGFHDKIANTVVIKGDGGRLPEPVAAPVPAPVPRQHNADPWKE